MLTPSLRKGMLSELELIIWVTPVSLSRYQERSRIRPQNFLVQKVCENMSALTPKLESWRKDIRHFSLWPVDSIGPFALTESCIHFCKGLLSPY